MRALVTGAAGGIGNAIAERLRAGGHHVLGQDLRATAVAPDLVGDLLDPAHLDEVVRRCREDGIDAVVAAHGIAAGRDFARIDHDYAARVMAVNTLSMLHLHDALDGLLAERDGVMLAIASQAGLVGEANNGIYSASKFAVVGWARGLAAAGTRTRIRVICPGATETPLLRQAFEGMAESAGTTYEDVLAQRSAQVPLGRLGRVSDLAEAVAWLVEVRRPQVLVAAVTGGEVLD